MVGVGANRYQYNGIEYIEEVQINLAPFRSYDPALGRWMQVDLFAELAPGWTPYRNAFNNPLLYMDPLGLFESKREARRHRRKERRAARKQGGKSNLGKIRRNKQGRYDIKFKNSDGGISQNSDGDIEYFAVATDASSETTRGGIELLTGVGSNSGGPDPEGTSSVIIDNFPVPFGGNFGAGGDGWLKWFSHLFDTGTNAISTAQNLDGVGLNPFGKDNTQNSVTPLSKTWPMEFITRQGVDPNFSHFPANGTRDTVANGVQIWNNGTRDSIVLRKYVREMTGTSPFGGHQAKSRPLNFDINVEK